MRLLEREQRIKKKMAARERGRLSGRRHILSGVITLGAGYMVSFILGAALLLGGEDDAVYMFIPFAGGPVYLGQFMSEGADRWRNDESYIEGTIGLVSFAVLLPTIAQLTGTCLIAVGMSKRRRYKREKSRSIAMSPSIHPKGGGFSFAMGF